ncbi:MAG: rhomboid family intramembrane serine protease [Bacteroidota bacterium]|nr:rhomboid family intramembrane serine protease [Bacteroidota bacterium]
MELKNRINLFISGLNILEKIIFLNVAIYLAPFLINTILFLFNIKNIDLLKWFTIDADFGQLIFKPWSIITYGFLHGSFSHIFWNMIILYYFGKILNNLFGDKLLKKLYLSGIVAGGLTYVISYNVFPVFRGVESVMIGASAGVMSVLFYLASYSPQMGIRIFFFDIKIIYIALFLFFYDIIQIPLNNSGGHIAHIGGAIWGYYYCISNNKGEDFTQSIFNIFKTTKKKNTKASQNNNNFDQKKIDSILDKISDSGYDSLTKKEKEYLFKVGKNQDK